MSRPLALPLRRTLIRLSIAAVCGGVPTSSLAAQQAGTAGGDSAAIRRVIAEQYVNAVFVVRDEAGVRRGFHPRFHLFVLDADTVIVAPLDMWLGRLKLDGVPRSDAMRHDVALLDIAGDAAVVRTELFENGRHIYTDYFSLYRFRDGGWRIVSKIFQDRD